ncbi:Veg family protein [Peptoniphilus sp. GNH]|nr:hypothetical protein HMPREF3189_01162 [Clostridiales bacterium KA00134]UHR02104.1 Veg family protein [Peptoniphilus sp. GNH]
MNQVEAIRRELRDNLGKRVIIKADKGRKKIITKRGVLEAVYPSLFVVNVESREERPRKTSFTYSDVLTHTVVLTILEEA